MSNKHEKEIKFSKKIVDLLNSSPTPYHVVENNINLLKKNGFEELSENEVWKLKPNGKYFVTRDRSAICAFIMPKTNNPKGFMITTSHSDHPCFRITDNPNNNVDNKYTVISTEPCPSPMYYSFVDVPLSVAGILTIKTKNGIKSVVVDAKKPILIIPNLASHMRDNVNEKGLVMNADVEMRPLFSLGGDGDIVSYVAKLNNVDPKEVISTDLFVYRASKAYIWGENDEFLSSRALDDQLCAYCSLFGILDANAKESIPMHLVFNSEEVGSSTRPGANSTFVNLIFERITECLDLSKQEFANMISNSFSLSADNAHGYHPNFQSVYNQQVKAYLGDGPAVKYSARKAYCTDAMGYTFVHEFAKKGKAKIQKYYNKPGDTPGSTLSKFFAPNTSILSADIGIPQFAMHSGFETCSAYDPLHLQKLCKAIFSSTIEMKSDGEYDIK